MQTYLSNLENAFSNHANPQIANEQSAYMKNLFPFFGIKTPLRRTLCAPLLQKKELPSKSQAFALVKKMWQKPEREYQYFAQELAYKFVRQLEKDDIGLIEWMIVHKSWWDTVDFIAAKIAGAYFKQFPQQIKSIIPQWMQSNNIWLQRSAILFQLKFKKEVDTRLLTNIILPLSSTKEFFLNKAIGWSLREYSKVNRKWVKDFVDKYPLNGVSRREALKYV